MRQKNGSTLPAWFDPDKMEPLKPQQVAWWDEMHRKCIIGGQRAGATQALCKISAYPRRKTRP
jgi:hypothetical protein